MTYCGIDMGKKSRNFCLVDEKRNVLKEGKVKNTREDLRKAFGRRPPMRICVEASTKSFWMADRLRELGHTVVVVDPGRTKAIGAGMIKNDRLDAREWGLKLARKRGRKKAVVAVARKLSGILWAMWKNQAAFEARLPKAA